MRADRLDMVRWRELGSLRWTRGRMQVDGLKVLGVFNKMLVYLFVRKLKRMLWRRCVNAIVSKGCFGFNGCGFIPVDTMKSGVR